jgi:signal transduction histidine kinase
MTNRGAARVNGAREPGDELRALRRRIIEHGDRARGQLARDLHDGPQQQFLVAIINAQRAQHKWSSDPVKARELLDACVAQAQAGLRTLGDLVAGVHPGILSDLGLRAAIETTTATMPLPVGLEISTERLPRPLETHVYFFVSEALTNVVKHARATSASVRVVATETEVIAEVRDDGIGGATPTSTGSGLDGLADRVHALDGRFTITSLEGRGTTLGATIPLRAEE